MHRIKAVVTKRFDWQFPEGNLKPQAELMVFPNHFGQTKVRKFQAVFERLRVGPQRKSPGTYQRITDPDLAQASKCFPLAEDFESTVSESFNGVVHKD
jgi:hypothetical protein